MESLDNLRDFVSYFDLMDNHSNIFLNAMIEIETSKRQANVDSEIMISYDDFPSAGKLTILDRESLLNPYEYPTIFYVEYQEFEFINNKCLKISGNHIKNSEIGKYDVIIYPL